MRWHAVGLDAVDMRLFLFRGRRRTQSQFEGRDFRPATAGAQKVEIVRVGFRFVDAVTRTMLPDTAFVAGNAVSAVVL